MTSQAIHAAIQLISKTCDELTYNMLILLII